MLLSLLMQSKMCRTPLSRLSGSSSVSMVPQRNGWYGFIGNNENWGKRMALVPAEACADCRDLTQAKHHRDETCRKPSPLIRSPALLYTPPNRPHPPPSPPPHPKSTNRPAMPESRKHPQERSITIRSGRQHPGEIAAGGHATHGGLPGADHAKGRTLAESPHAKTKEDAVAIVIEANRELAPPSCSPLFRHRIY